MIPEPLFRAIVFDMDGVLLLSSAVHDRAFRETLASYAVREFNYSSVAGMRTDSAMRRILSDNAIEFDDALIASLASRKTAMARELLAAEMPVAPGCASLMPRLASRYPLGLASSASRGSVELFLHVTGLRPCFTSILSGADVEHAKPAPDIYRLACARLGVESSDTLVVEDAVQGVQSAKAAGATVWAIAGEPRHTLLAAGADRVIETLQELRELCQ